MGRRLVVAFAALGALVILGAGYLWQKNPGCATLPGAELLPNADLARDADGDAIPDGWNAAIKGPARLAAPGDFTVDGQGRSFQLIGIANSVSTPAIAVQPHTSYCFVGQALTDGARPDVLPTPTSLQLRFSWRNSGGQIVGEHYSDWLPVKTPTGGGWSLLRVAANAPAAAASLSVSLHPAGDDRIYLDEMHLRRGGSGLPWPRIAQAQNAPLPVPANAARIRPWPQGKRAALSFSFDWETTMGGLIHSRSAGDPNFDQDAVARGLRMRQGISETLQIFAPFGVRATYYATGYNFLSGNPECRRFMGDPTYSWATPENRWLRDWSALKWFGDDPCTTLQDGAANGPAWYFGDLVPGLVAAGQDIQSHTFAHFYGGLVEPDDWRADFAAWQEVAQPHGIGGPTSLAFPWSSSGGMTYAAWQALTEAGVRSVVRLSDQPQYQLFEYAGEVPVAPRCLPLPGHASILACPDVYLTPGQREQNALQAIDNALASEGAVDVWAHTEEVTSPQQIAAWRRVVGSAAQNPALWIAPLAEIAAWQQAIAQVDVQQQSGDPYRIAVTNRSNSRLEGVTVTLPFRARSIQLFAGQQLISVQDTVQGEDEVVLTLEPGQRVEVQAWPV